MWITGIFGKKLSIYCPPPLLGGQKENGWQTGQKNRRTNNTFLSKEPGQPESKVQDKHTNELDQPK